jgi:branched-chain amino acid transport system ATP-binding protein
MVLLETKILTKNFGGLTAVSDLSIEVHKGEIVGLIGPNGAGKTTVFNLITSFFSPNKGHIIFKGQDITGLKPDQVAKKGIIRTFQLTRLFGEYSVLKNVLMAQHLHTQTNFWKEFCLPRSMRRTEGVLLQYAEEILNGMGLYEKRDELAKNLPHGHQRSLAVSIALAAQPELLLLDEPTAGMNPEETRIMMHRIHNIADRGITVLLIEHDMKVVMGLCRRIVVLNYGRKIAEGTPQEIMENSEVIQAYLGVPDVVAKNP